MSATPEKFSTGVRNSEGRWPQTPQVWSYSSLNEADECPRRWMLSRATYPEIWPRHGYPSRPILAALLGDVVHRILELVLQGFHARGCSSFADPCAVAVLKDLGGYSKLAELVIDEQMDRLGDNPRARTRIDGLRSALSSKVPEIRQRVQEIVTRTSLQPVSASSNAEAPTERFPLVEGSHPEVELRAPELRLAGRADLLTVTKEGCEITDYKTGESDPHHADQLRTYALLWSRDRELNPDGLPVRRLVLSYRSRDIEVDPPSITALADLAARMDARISAAEDALRKRPPPARPSVSMCRLCSVRQLCDDYWAAWPNLPPPTSSVEPESNWFDYEGIVTSQNGPRSWLVATVDGSELLLRTPSETTTFRCGDRVRMLGLLRGDDPESRLPIGTLTQASEVFLLDESV